MIPKANIREWREYAPWLFDEQVEQDLIISRIIIEIFNVPELASGFAFRGGTALQKIYLNEKFRYSEDIDLVQFQKNLEQRRKSKIFNTDMHALLPGNMSYDYDVEWIYHYLFNEIVHRLPGESWKSLDNCNGSLP